MVKHPADTRPKISSSLIHHVLIFSKGEMTKKLTHVSLCTSCGHCIGQPHPIRGQYWVILTNHVTGSVWRVMMSWPKCSECGGDRHCTRGRSPDSLYAALLVIRSSVKLSIAKTQDIGWLGDAWNYKFPAFYLNPRVAQPTIADRIQTQIWKTLLASGKSLPVSVSHPD